MGSEFNKEVEQSIKDVETASRTLTRQITQAHRDHANGIVKSFSRQATKKYYAGVREHGGHIKEMSLKELISNAMDEAIDQYVYLHTLLEKIEGTK